ncbi:MAG TPA: hypothetical protein PLW93_00330 [Candidatus Absconditabacterales bacterium]|nr:hypothetical protein [Candidatus Absconditabacterales bacterium]HNG96699.1 hypothetical protein [Candidatus Absconditabacterales bacterium]
MYIVWDIGKNDIIKNRKGGGGITFSFIAHKIYSGDIIFEGAHPNATYYPHQRIFVVLYNNYPFVVPYIILDEKNMLLKLITAYPSRKAKLFL